MLNLKRCRKCITALRDHTFNSHLNILYAFASTEMWTHDTAEYSGMFYHPYFFIYDLGEKRLILFINQL